MQNAFSKNTVGLLTVVDWNFDRGNPRGCSDKKWFNFSITTTLFARIGLKLLLNRRYEENKASKFARKTLFNSILRFTSNDKPRGNCFSAKLCKKNGTGKTQMKIDCSFGGFVIDIRQSFYLNLNKNFV